jgi:hypothetical protein
LNGQKQRTHERYFLSKRKKIGITLIAALNSLFTELKTGKLDASRYLFYVYSIIGFTILNSDRLNLAVSQIFKASKLEKEKQRPKQLFM